MLPFPWNPATADPSLVDGFPRRSTGYNRVSVSPSREATRSAAALIMSHNSVLDTGNDLNMSLLMELSMLQAKNFYKYYTPVGVERGF